MAANPQNPEVKAVSPQSTALSAVFRRLAGGRPGGARPRAPEIEGFGEPASTAQVPLHGFEEVSSPRPSSPVPACEPALGAAAGVPAETVEPVAASAAPDPVIEPQNLAGRLVRRLGEVPRPSSRPAAAAEAPPATTRAASSHARPLGAPAGELAVLPPPVAEPGVPGPATDAVTPAPGSAVGTRRPSKPRNRRLHRRVNLSAGIEVAGVACTLIDVSIGGFAVTGMPQIAANTTVPVMLRIGIDGIDIGTQLSARIIYATPTRASGRFVELTGSQTAFLRHIVTWRGESVGVVGTTTLLDAIAGTHERGLSTTGSGRSGGQRERWWAGMLGRKLRPPR